MPTTLEPKFMTVCMEQEWGKRVPVIAKGDSKKKQRVSWALERGGDRAFSWDSAGPLEKKEEAHSVTLTR